MLTKTKGSVNVLLDERKALILATVVEQFIKSGVPVGSKFVAEHLMRDGYPATVRNDMATLESSRLLEQPNNSFSRKPTNAGYRY